MLLLVIVVIFVLAVNAQLDPQLPDAVQYPSKGIRLAQCCNAILSRVPGLDYFPSHSTLLGLHHFNQIQPWDTSIDFSFDSSTFRDVVIEFVRSSDCLDAEMLIWNWKTSSFVKAEKAPSEYHLWNGNYAELFHRMRFVWRDKDPLLTPAVNLYSIARQADSELRWTVVPYEKSQQTKFASDLPPTLFFPTIPCNLAELGRTRCPSDIELYLNTMFSGQWRTPWKVWDDESEKYVELIVVKTAGDESMSFVTKDCAILLGVFVGFFMTAIYRRRGVPKKE